MSAVPRFPSVRPPNTRTLVVLVVAAILIAPLPLAEAAYRDVDEASGTFESKRVSLLAPAVGELENGTLIGVTMSLDVSIRNGTGGVFVDTRPLTQVDMQGSARLAASVASSIGGRPVTEQDYFITMRADVPTVGGPSAGATMTVGFAALLLDLPVRDDVVMTGMVNPDGSVGPVGGILQKAEAAHRAGAQLFLIPEGQAIVTQVTRSVEGDGWFPQVVEREQRINVTEYAADRWGMEVREVDDVYAAIEAFTDHTVSRPAVPTQEGPSEVFVQVMGEKSATQLAEARAELVDVRAALTASGLGQEAPSTHGQLASILDRTEARLARADGAYQNGSYYTASSLAFQSFVDLRLVDVWLQTLDAPDQRAFLAGYGENLSTRLEATRGLAAAAEADTVSGLEAVGAAQVRVLEAERRLAEGRAALADDRIADTVAALSFTEERRRSVEWWLEIQDELSGIPGGAALEADPTRLAEDYFGIAQQAVAYAAVLLGETGQSPNLARLLNDASTALTDAAAAEAGALSVGAMYLAIKAQVDAYAALSLVGSEDLLPDRIERQRAQALLNVARTREAGAEPFLAVSYMDFAESLRATDPVAALQMYGNAATIAATSRVLATGEVCGFGPVSCGQSVPKVARLGFPAPDPWTAYLALATLLLGFMAGLFVTLLVQEGRQRRHPAQSAIPVGVHGARPLGLTNGNGRAHRPSLPAHVPRTPPVQVRAARAVAMPASIRRPVNDK